MQEDYDEMVREFFQGLADTADTRLGMACTALTFHGFGSRKRKLAH